MFHLILFEPEIPPNTGNIIRLCANTGSSLHLVRPLGFELDDKRVRRAGLDYHEYVSLVEHDSLAACLDSLGDPRLVAVSTHGTSLYTDYRYAKGDAILLGPETRGLPAEVLGHLPAAQVVRIPMQPGNRSINLSNAAAIVLYEAWSQNNFIGGH